jgi:hypothetical protein
MAFFRPWQETVPGRPADGVEIQGDACGPDGSNYNSGLKRGAVAQLVRVPDCRSGGCGFEPRRPRSLEENAGFMPGVFHARPSGRTGGWLPPERQPDAGGSVSARSSHGVCRLTRPLRQGRSAAAPRARPIPNWSPTQVTEGPCQWTSSIFSLCTARPCSSTSCPTTARRATSMISPVEG